MTALAMVVFFWSLVASGFVVYVIVRLPRAARSSVDLTPVLLVRPADALLPAERLAIGVQVAGSVRTVIASPEDPHVVGALWVRSDPAEPNRKVGHLIAASRLLRPDEIFVCADADVIVDGALLAQLAAAVRSGAAIAVATPRTVGGKGAAAVLLGGVLDQSLLSFRAQAGLGGNHAVCGKVIALAPNMIERLESVGHVVAEDLALVSLARAANLSVVTVEQQARVVAAREPSVRAVLDRMTRWLIALKLQRPLAYAGLPIFVAPTLPLTAMTLVSRAPLAWAGLVALCALRCLLAARLVRGRLQPRPFGWVLADVLLFLAFAKSLLKRRVTWRGRTLGLVKQGRIVRREAVP